jgi:2-dehydro-3-deoxygalactonokinase
MPPESTVFFIGCDWGSTSFRLRLVERGTRRISEEVSEPAGVKTFATLSAAERAERMARLLGERVAAWPKAPLIVTGMASANVGWHELPYATAPFPLDGAGVRTARLPFPAAHGATRSALLVSGVCTEDDVMRGEECALIGACVLRPELARRDGLCLLAGTHPKHARLRDGALVSFATLLTGELFDVRYFKCDPGICSGKPRGGRTAGFSVASLSGPSWSESKPAVPSC